MSRTPISDLDLYANLKRRTADPRSSWSADNFVARVNSKMDTQATVVRVSRAPALIGAASVLAVLMVLVVALPNLRPGQSATPEPSPRPPGAAMTPAEFQASFAAGELNGKSVVVNGRILPYDLPGYPYGAVCAQEPAVQGAQPVGFDCVMGRLSGTEPALWPNAPYLAVGVDEWRAAVPPAEGALVLNVTDNGFIEYIGTVAVTAGEPSSVRAASTLDLDSLDLDDVVLVDASLNGVGHRECPAYPSSIPGLPGRGCEPSTLTDASGSMTVQDNAYYRFAPDPDPKPTTGVVTPRRAIYAIAKRLEGCDETPCWQWQVVARLGGELGEQVGPSQTPDASAPAPPPSQGVSTRFECTGPPLPPEMTPSPGPVPVVIDLTGLVVSCLQPDVFVGLQGEISVTNQFEENRIHVEWVHRICDGAIVFTFSGAPHGSGYDLSGDRPAECPANQGSLPIEIVFSEPISADQVHPTIDGVAPQSADLECSDDGSEPVRMFFTDNTGLVSSCEKTAVTAPSDGDPMFSISVLNGDRPGLRVIWSESACYGAAGLRLSSNVDGGYSLAIHGAPDEVSTCVDFVTNNGFGDRIWRGVVIYLHEAIHPDSVEVQI